MTNNNEYFQDPRCKYCGYWPCTCLEDITDEEIEASLIVLEEKDLVKEDE